MFDQGNYIDVSQVYWNMLKKWISLDLYDITSELKNRNNKFLLLTNNKHIHPAFYFLLVFYTIKKTKQRTQNNPMVWNFTLS